MQVLNQRSHGLPRGAVYVGRPSPYGNPFEIGKDGDRAAVIELYRAWILTQPALLAKVRSELKGKDLVCWCAPLPCHADVLLSLANDIPNPRDFIPF